MRNFQLHATLLLPLLSGFMEPVYAAPGNDLTKIIAVQEAEIAALKMTQEYNERKRYYVAEKTIDDNPFSGNFDNPAGLYLVKWDSWGDAAQVADTGDAAAIIDSYVDNKAIGNERLVRLKGQGAPFKLTAQKIIQLPANASFRVTRTPYMFCGFGYFDTTMILQISRIK